MNLKVSISLDSYIAEPFWPELSDVINIQKKSRMNFARTDAKREACLKAYLSQEGIAMADYEALVAASKRRWYRDDTGQIIVPRHHIAGALVQTLNVCPASVRGKFTADSFRHHCKISDFVTGKKEKDVVFDRYVKNDKSNERRRQQSEVLQPCRAVGSVNLSDQFKQKDFENLLRYCLSECGIGSCRKMGFGFGTLLSIKED